MDARINNEMKVDMHYDNENSGKNKRGKLSRERQQARENKRQF